MAEYSDAFGSRVEQILKEKELSPYDVARRADGEISHQTVRNMARGQVPSPKLVIKFALTVGVHPNDLLELTGWELHWTGRKPASVRRRIGSGARPAQPVLAR